MVQPGDPVNSQDRWGMSTKNTILQHRIHQNICEQLRSHYGRFHAFSCVFWMLTFSKPLEPLLGPIKFTAKRCNFFVVPQDGSPSRSGFPEPGYGWLTLVVPLYKGPIKVEASYLGGWARHKPWIPVIQF